MTSTEHLLKVDGIEVVCHHGGVRQPDEDPVVLLHGIGGSTAGDFKFLFPMLARHYSVLAVDFSPPALSEGETLELGHLVKQVHAVLDQLLPGRRATIVGYSLGAVVAAAVAASHPAPAGLVLVSGWLEATAAHRMFNSIWQHLRGQDEAVLQQFARFSALGTSFANSTPVQEFEEILPFRPGPFTDAQVQLTTRTNLSDAAPLISVPTLVIGCSHDAIADRDQAQALVGAIEDARYAEVESGHAVVTERPAEILSLIDGFLQKRPRYAPGDIPPGIAV